jgi:cobalt-zinc-cadmium efflux system membrane fusion protein
MKQFISVCLLWAAVACNNGAPDSHAHNADGSHPGEAELQSLSFTKYSALSELFVEFKPLIVGSTSKFAVHLTKLGETFTPYLQGNVTVSLIQGENGIRQSVDAPGSPGIFRLELQPGTAKPGKLVFDIQTPDFRDQIVIDSVKVYPDQKTAIADQPREAAGADIPFLKEQAWKIEFANEVVRKETIFDVIKAIGEIQSAPGDAVTIAAKSNGIVKYIGNNNVIGSAMRSGQAMFSVSGGNIAFENVEAAKQTAAAELVTSKATFERTSELIKDKLITQKEFQESKLRYEQAEISFNNLARNYVAGGRSLSSPVNGFVESILVSEGQYVTAGQPLATINKNQRVVLKANVSLRDAPMLGNVQEANFTLVQNKKSYNTRDLHGRLLSVGKTTSSNSPFIPLHFSIDKQPEMLPGSFAEVYLKTSAINNALVIPASALVEEQGIFYAYVQTEGESFQKRELKLGANDGQQVQILSGLSEGERVVTKGGYQIKLSQAGGSLPAHGHEH